MTLILLTRDTARPVESGSRVSDVKDSEMSNVRSPAATGVKARLPVPW